MPKRKLKSKSVAVVDIGPAIIERNLLAFARSLTNERARKFVFAMANSLPHMSGNDMDAIEPTLHRIIGRRAVERAMTGG